MNECLTIVIHEIKRIKMACYYLSIFHKPLAECGADVNRRNGYGETPLFLAASAGHAPALKLRSFDIRPLYHDQHTLGPAFENFFVETRTTFFDIVPMIFFSMIFPMGIVVVDPDFAVARLRSTVPRITHIDLKTSIPLQIICECYTQSPWLLTYPAFSLVCNVSSL